MLANDTNIGQHADADGVISCQNSADHENLFGTKLPHQKRSIQYQLNIKKCFKASKKPLFYFNHPMKTDSLRRMTFSFCRTIARRNRPVFSSCRPTFQFWKTAPRDCRTTRMIYEPIAAFCRTTTRCRILVFSLCRSTFQFWKTTKYGYRTTKTARTTRLSIYRSRE